MIPGKTLKPEDILEAAWRRRWLIIVPFVVIAASTVLIASFLPDRYRSETVLLIVPQRVPENFVRSTVTARLDERLRAMSQQILSRTRLEQIIQDFNLYPTERRSMIMEDVVETMRTRDVSIGLRGGGRADDGTFTISFQSDSPKTAMLVTERLASLFIKENIEDRALFADMTDQFLQTQLDDARRQLMEHEKKLEVFRRANAGRLPSEADTNQQAMLNTQMQLQALQDSINRDRDRQMLLQRLIADASSLPAPAIAPESPGATSQLPAARQLELARDALKRLEGRLKPDHPDIRIAKRTIRDLEEKAAAETLEQPISPSSGAPRGTSPAEIARAAKVADYQAEVESVGRQIAAKQEQEKALMVAMAGYRTRLEASPALESDLTSLMRDYSTLQATYQSLLSKSQEAKVAANLERRQIGEQFKVIDNARLPQRPMSPNRLRIDLLGAFAGLGLGLGLAGLLEYRDSSLRSEEDVILALALPVLALVPTMMTRSERRQQRQRRVIALSSAAVALLLCVAAVAWKIRILENWIR